MTETPVPSYALPDSGSVPIRALRLATRNLISCLLNPKKIIPNDNGLPRDWRGLAHLIGLKVEKIPVLACDNDPTARILHLWQKEDNPPCTIKQFMDFLSDLDRFDIVDDAKEMIDKDISNYINEPEKHTTSVSPVVDEVDRHILTRDDVCRFNQGLDTQNYDAFVVFADEDIDFATELIEKMEKFGLKLCVKERDLVAGLPFEHKAIIELISERCNRLIVIISPAFLKSSANKFVVSYAQALGIEQGKRKIIPCIYEHCEPPLELRHTFSLHFQRSGRLYNFWDRLKESIQAPSFQPSPRLNTQRPISLEIKQNYMEKLPDLKPALTNKNNLKPKKENVKFGSLSNLTAMESNETKRSASVNVLNSECASSNAEVAPVSKKDKNFKNFFKKLMKHKDSDKSQCNGVEEKGKKKKSRLKLKIPVFN